MGQHAGYITGPLQMAAGAGLSALVPGGAALGVPLMTSGLGTTVGQAAGGSSGAKMGGMVGGLAGGLGEGDITALPKMTGEATYANPYMQAMGGAGLQSPGAVAANTAMMQGPFATPQAAGDQLSQPLSQIGQGATAQPATPATPQAAGASTPVTKEGLSGLLQSLSGSGLVPPAVAMASQLFGGGGGGQQQSKPQAPAAPRLNAQATAPGATPPPVVTNVPARASFTGGQPPMMTMPAGSDMAARLQALRLLQGQG